MADKKTSMDAPKADTSPLEEYEIPQGTTIWLDGKEYNGAGEADPAIVKQLKRIINGDSTNA